MLRREDECVSFTRLGIDRYPSCVSFTYYTYIARVRVRTCTCRLLSSPYTVVVLEYDIPINEQQVKAKLRQEFEKNKHITDMRVIDMLVIKVSLSCVR